ncbi:MAG: hypothetical protein ACFUZC_11930 [Chthoniobacteraceae bacterium]
MMTSLILRANTLGSFRKIGSFGFNTCHSILAMRNDLQEQMGRAHRELGMRYWRCHGMLSDDVGVVARDEKGTLRYTFSGLKRILDQGLSQGLKPFFEVSFMPAALARDASQTICHYRGITSPPRDWEEWRGVIRQLIEFLGRTYGAEELRQWYFEVWNEPNLPFWTGTREEYFQLYRETALALKAFDSGLRIGGPATARGEWVTELLDFCRESRTPIDFISTHIYPSDVAFAPSAEGTVNLSDEQARLLAQASQPMRAEIAADPASRFHLKITSGSLIKLTLR